MSRYQFLLDSKVVVDELERIGGLAAAQTIGHLQAVAVSANSFLAFVLALTPRELRPLPIIRALVCSTAAPACRSPC